MSSAAPDTATPSIPRVGAVANVRNRRGLVTAVAPFDGGTEGRVHLVTVEYLDPDGVTEDQLLWEREPGARLLEPTALPDPSREPPMPHDEFDALVRATRWTALTPYVDPDGAGPIERLPLSAPFRGAIQVEDFQLVPLLKALRMPRVSLLLADDVGLGKTIEAGLILTELIQRRRVRRVLILCPASLRTQWKQELHDKFSLSFDIIDRARTHRLQRDLGLDANPWRTFPRIITSYDYLKQPDVHEQFRAASKSPDGSPHLPWDILIVDEVHNLTPGSFGNDSDVSRMLRVLAPSFEHKVFLTATPHNGHTRSFTGLLECLDPVRFSQKSEPLTENEKTRVQQVVVRRLKSEINARTNPPRFAERELEAMPLALSPEEQALSAAFESFRKAVHKAVNRNKKTERLAGAFAVEILSKRLLSCPTSFADSWTRYRSGMKEEDAAKPEEVRAAERSYREETGDDRESEGRAAHAVRTVGAWLKPLADKLTRETQSLDAALQSLDLGDGDEPIVERNPERDARFAALQTLIDQRLENDERIVIFTEYKTTLDYLERRLKEFRPAEGFVRVLYGGMGDDERDEIKSAFNAPADPVRILVATDAASEGLNLQETARMLLHYDIPWNPARLEQRNGRLDRHGQARDVTVFHFTSEEDADLKFLAHVVDKVNTIREDLGSTGEVFDAAIERRLIEGESAERVEQDLDRQLERTKGRAQVPRAREEESTGETELASLKALASEVDLDADTLKDTLDVAMGRHYRRPYLEGPDSRGRFRLGQPVPPRWQDLVDDALRLDSRSGAAGALPAVLFNPTLLIRDVGGRPVFRPEPDSRLLHLGHPVFHQALARFARDRFPGAGDELKASRWTVRRGDVPAGADALILLTVEELGVNELRETFHHWVRTLEIPVRNDELEPPLPHRPAEALRVPPTDINKEAQERASTFWDEVHYDVKELVDRLASDLTKQLRETLEKDGKAATERENERYQSRQGEVSALIAQTTIERLEREIESLRVERDQGVLFDHEERLADLERSIEEKEEEVRKRCAHYEELRQQLERERERVIRHLLPKRYALHGQAQVFPVAVEIRLPETT